MSDERINLTEEAARLETQILDLLGHDLPALVEVYKSVVQAAEGAVVISSEMEGILGLVEEAGQQARSINDPGETGKVDLAETVELEARQASFKDWVPSKNLCTHYFPYGNNLEVSINHLLHLATLRQFGRDSRSQLDFAVLRRVQRGVEKVATMGATSARHIPLPLGEERIEGWRYMAHGQAINALKVTPGYHASEEWLREVRGMNLEYTSLILETDVLPGQRLLEVRKDRSASWGRLVSHIESHDFPGVRLWQGILDRETHGSWELDIFRTKSGRYMIEGSMFVAKSSAGDRRARFAPFIVVLHSTPEDMESLVAQISETAANAGGDRYFSRQLVAFLMATLYYRSDPEFPYMCTDVFPSSLRHFPNEHSVDFERISLGDATRFQYGKKEFEQILLKALAESSPNNLSILEKLRGVDVTFLEEELRGVFYDADELFRLLYAQVEQVAKKIDERFH